MKYKKYIITFLLLCEFISLFLTYKSFLNNPLSEIKEENKIDKKQFSMYIKNSEGDYEEYTTSNYFPEGYNLNLENSICVDNNGNEIKDLLSGNGNNVTVTSNKTSYCYLYFDLIPTLSTLCNNGDNLGSCLTTNNSEIESLNDNMEGELYRYQGINEIANDNYICFGTTDRDECTSNTDAYMYRIIGVNESGQLKLIKKEALSSTMKWNSSTGVTWPNSTIYSNINDSSFLNNTTYVPTSWSSKIATISWKYGDTSSTSTYNGVTTYTTEGAWTDIVSAKIGLMYMHDYLLAYSDGNPGNYSNAKTAWIHISNCDSSVTSSAEWTMSRRSSSGTWGVYNSGTLTSLNVSVNSLYIRPVFYLNAAEIYVSGNGTIDNPIIIGDIN